MTRSRPFLLVSLGSLVLVLGSVLSLSVLAASRSEIAAVRTEPDEGAEVDRPVRNLRVWFDRSPDVDRSSISLVGPNGELEVTGLHTMGDDDLMARVSGAMPDGEYTATWKAAGLDSEDGQAEGQWGFTIERKR